MEMRSIVEKLLKQGEHIERAILELLYFIQDDPENLPAWVLIRRDAYIIIDDEELTTDDVEHRATTLAMKHEAEEMKTELTPLQMFDKRNADGHYIDVASQDAVQQYDEHEANNAREESIRHAELKKRLDAVKTEASSSKKSLVDVRSGYVGVKTLTSNKQGFDITLGVSEKDLPTFEQAIELKADEARVVEAGVPLNMPPVVEDVITRVDNILFEEKEVMDEVEEEVHLTERDQAEYEQKKENEHIIDLMMSVKQKARKEIDDA